MIRKLDHLDYEEIIEHVIDSYTKEFGERKFLKVYKKVMTSNKISGLIGKVKYKGLPPGSKDFLYCLNEIPFFMIASGQTQAVAALIALQRWNEEVNSYEYMLNDDGLRLRAVNIIEESKSTFI